MDAFTSALTLTFPEDLEELQEFMDANEIKKQQPSNIVETGG